MRQAIGRKLRSRAGESIAETLVSVLIAAVALVMLAGMISTTLRLVEDSSKKIEAYYTANDALTKLSVLENEDVTTYSGTISIKVDPDLSEAIISEAISIPAKNVTFYQNGNYSDAKRTVCAYGEA